MTLFNNKPDTNHSGAQAEKRALEHLKSQGLKKVTQNYRCKLGEIDLIMTDRSVLVFVEVRFRKSSDFGSAVETVTASKQNKIRKAAQHYLMSKCLGDTVTARFDVVGLDGQNITWIKNAFY